MQPDFGQFSPYLTDIPLDPNTFPLPYNDLKFGGSIGRVPYFPQDIIPTLSVVTLFGNKPPNLLRDSHVDGAADVYVVGQSGGSSSPSKFTVTESGGDAGLLSLSGGTVHGGSFGYSSSDPMVLCTIEVIPAFNGTAPGAYCEWQVGVDNNGSDPSITLVQGNFYKNQYTAYALAPSRWTMPGETFDYEASGLIPGTACFWVRTTSGQVVAAITYALGS